MFEKDYKNAMNGINPAEESLENVKNAMLAEAKEKPKTFNRKTLTAIAAACLCAVFTMSAIMIPLKLAKPAVSNGAHVVPAPDDPITETKHFDYSVGNGIRKAKSLKEIEEIAGKFKDTYRAYGYTGLLDGLFLEDVEVKEEADAPEGTVEKGSPSSGGEEHSDTNNQVSGVQEGDIIKNDGKYIYFYRASEKKIVIIFANSGDPQKLSAINSGEIIEFYLCGNKLVTLSHGERKTRSAYDEDKTVINIYDITDRENPKKETEHTQSGYYVSGRVVGKTLYVISSKYSYKYNYFYAIIDDVLDKEPDLELSLPALDGDEVNCGDVYLPDNAQNGIFTTITSLDLDDAKEFKSSVSILGASDTLYASENCIYITASVYTDAYRDEELKKAKKGTYVSCSTDIYRIAYNDGELTPCGYVQVPGSIWMDNRQFAMDEYNGYFRIATNINTVNYEYFNGETYFTVSKTETANQVFVYDEELKKVGESDVLGKGEMLKSVRYMGDIVYVVTFRNTDPVYAIDLTDPTAPKTLSELKINGFSTYMQSYGSDYMLGIGYEADVESGGTTGIKLTMFDISDPTDVSAVSSVKYLYDYGSNDNKYHYMSTDATYNHKALLLDRNKGIIAIPIFSETFDKENDKYTQEYKYVFYTFDGKELKEGRTVTFNKEHPSYYYYTVSSLRGLYIGDYAYVVGDDAIAVIDLKNMDFVKLLEF